MFLFAQGFFGVFPWQIITYWLFLYMEEIRGFTQDEQLMIMVAGNLVAEVMTDWMFRKTPRGRPLFAGISVVMGLVFFDLTLLTRGGALLFLVLGVFAGFFTPMAGPGVSASLQDIALPEVRSTVLSLQLFMENVGSAFAPLITGILADVIGLEMGMVIIITVTWLLCSILLTSAALTISEDIEWKRRALTERARRLSQ
ncbi:MAG: hypothetical protein ACUVQ0_03930 [Thermoproteota archaeon]